MGKPYRLGDRGVNLNSPRNKAEDSTLSEMEVALLRLPRHGIRNSPVFLQVNFLLRFHPNRAVGGISNPQSSSFPPPPNPFGRAPQVVSTTTTASSSSPGGITFGRKNSTFNQSRRGGGGGPRFGR